MDIKNVLIVGSWAKEQITVEHLKTYSFAGVYVYMDIHNPGILATADGYFIGSLTDIDAIVQYARACHADIVLVTTAAPLSAGLCDVLEKKSITAFGPSQSAGRLETDKAFTRELMQKHLSDYIPAFQVFTEAGPAIDFAKAHDWQVAVKPVGLSEGLGVRVFGDQLPDEKAVIGYIEHILKENLTGHHKVIIEEKLTGTEFTLQCLVNGTDLVATPAVQDFKKKLAGEKGPNTASMGSYSDRVNFLPFMQADDYERALDCCRRTLEIFLQETGQICRGFLYGQFMISNKGLKLIEYNFRPGDPEWMNTIMVLESNLLESIEKLLRGDKQRMNFRKLATVCKYLVPPQYPEKLNEVLDIDFDPRRIGKATNFYYSCDKINNQLQVGHERGIALIAAAKTIEQAHRTIEDAVSSVRGTFFYRQDIGMHSLCADKIRYVTQLGNAFSFRNATADAFLEIHDFIGECPPLEQYPPHVFKIILRYSGKCCFVAYKGNKLIGWVMGLTSTDGDIYFLWQIGIHPSVQGQGVGALLLDYVEKNVRLLGCDTLQLTIDPQNIPSRKLFEKAGYLNISDQEGAVVTVNEHAAVKDFYKPGRHFMIYEKKMDNEKNAPIYAL